MITQPMLASNVDLKRLKFPVLVTPKLDGIRCLKVNGQCISRTFKPIPNHYIRNIIEEHLPDGVDGELICGNFNETTSSVMTEEGEPDFRFKIFDYVKHDLNTPYNERMVHLSELSKQLENEYINTFIDYLIPKRIDNFKELYDIENFYLEQGYEGIMIRSIFGPYKCGRSTTKEGYLLKLKRFEDSEAVVIGFEELMHNDNELKTDNFGYANRSVCKDNLIPMNTLGSLVVKDIETGYEFGIGSGFTASQREEIWNNQNEYINKIVKYKHQLSGKKDAPRFPVFIGFRDVRDL